MKVLYFEGTSKYYLYPDGVHNLEEFSDFLEICKTDFFKIRALFEKNCVQPYFIFEEIKEVYVAKASIDEFYEAEVVVLERDEYEKMLVNIKKKLCSRCEEKEECYKDSKQEYREKICLDGTCFEFCEEE